MPVGAGLKVVATPQTALIRFDGGDEALVVEPVLVELGELFVALGGDGFALGVGLHHNVHGPLYGHARDHFLQHGDDVLHRRIVIVVQYDLVRGLLGDAALYLYPRLRFSRRGGRDRYTMQRWYASHFHLRIAEQVITGKIPRRSRMRNPIYPAGTRAIPYRLPLRRCESYVLLSSRHVLSAGNPRGRRAHG